MLLFFVSSKPFSLIRGEEPSTRVRNPRDDAAHTALNIDGDAALLASASSFIGVEGFKGSLRF